MRGWLTTLRDMGEMTYRVCRLVWRGRIAQVRHYVRMLEGYQVYLEGKGD